MVKELEGTSLFQKQYYQTTILSEHTGLCSSNEEFKNAMDIAFGISPFIYFLFGDVHRVSYTSAIYHAGNNTIFAFDPHSRNQKGLPSPNGSAVLLRYNNFHSLHQYLSDLSKAVSADYYEIVANKEATNKREKRRKLDKDAIRKVREKEKGLRKKRREKMSVEKLSLIKQKDTSARKEKRQIMSKEDSDKIKRKETSSRKKKRECMNKKDSDKIKQKDTSSRREKRKS
ncbi:probable DNA-directed RNA polymerase I subunit RPA43 [Saccostrea cucullata]|uniref:probable DNA-directed RNA polymerase I subunit RPA43 n=1 Tax=Saccostrea cuccullata TaxID=36930 RepID=UPI002ED060E9